MTDKSRPPSDPRAPWRAYVRARLQLPALAPEREAEAIEELAQQLEDVGHEAAASGADAASVRALIDQHIPDWARLSDDLTREDARRSLALARRWHDRFDEPESRWRRLTVGLVGDLLYSVRALRKDTAFSATSILTLALGIGAAAALFSLVHALLLQPLPFKHSDRLVRLTSLRTNGEAGGISYPDFEDWVAQSQSFEEMAVYSSRSVVLDASDRVTRVRGAVVSLRLLELLGASPSLGRAFLPGEDAPAADDVVILSQALWRDQFGSDPQVLGRRLRIDRRTATIVGVMAAGVRFPVDEEPADVWMTIAVDRRGAAGEGLASQRGVHYLSGLALLKPGVRVEQAQAEMSGIVSALNRQHPEDNPRGIRVRPELTELVADVRSVWWALFGASACLWLIACANVVNMLLARGAARRNDVAMRMAIGASRARLVRQLLIEHALIGCSGGGLGVVIASWGVALIRDGAPSTIPRVQEAGLNGTVLLFAAAVSLAAIALFGIGPALRLSAQDPARLTSLSDRGLDPGGRRVRQAIVIAQTALAVVLLVAGGLFFRTVVSLNQVALGYDAAEVMSFRVDLPDDYTPARERRFFEEVLEQVRALPGVVTASAAYAVPLSNRDFVTSFDIEGRPTTGERDETAFNIVEPGYFGTLGIPLTQGRDFGAGDDLQSMPVAIVNETFARRYFGDRSAIGQHITPGIGNGYKADPIREIVAVVADIRSSALRTAPSAHVFVPAAQCPSIGATTIVLRSAVDEATLAKNAQRLVSEFDRSIPIFSVKRLADYVSDWVLQPQFSSRLLGLFAALSSTLAAIGLYGLISYSVAQRRREIGVRIALGAAPRGVLALVLRQGVGIALAGVALGLVLATIVTGWIAAELYGVGPRDPLTLIGVALLLVVAAAAACAIPARRALRVDPIAALRGQ